MLLGQDNPSFNTVWEQRISANASPDGFLGFVINSTSNILNARGLTHSGRHGNVKNIVWRNTDLHNTKKAIYFTTPKIRFIKHPKFFFFALLQTGPFLRVRHTKQGAVCVGQGFPAWLCCACLRLDISDY